MGRIKAALVIQNSVLGGFETNLEQTCELVDMACVRFNADIVVFPEMNLTGYGTGDAFRRYARSRNESWTEQLSMTATTHATTILAGLAEVSADLYHATHMVFGSTGSVGCYRKVHLAPQEAPVLTAGDEIPVFKESGLSFGIQLCYDAHFPELSQALALKGADVIFMPHASPKNSPREKRSSWLRHMTARAFDNSVYVMAVNACGDNGKGLSFPGVALVIGPDGRVRAEASDSGILAFDIDLDEIAEIRSHRMRYFLPNRRADLFPGPKTV